MKAAEPDPRNDLTLALRDLGAGRSDGIVALLPVLMEELRAQARASLGARNASHTLQPTALVNEVFLKLFGSAALERIHDREHFFALAGRAMRQILIDHARARRAAKLDGAAAAESTSGGALERAAGADDVRDDVLDDVLDVDAALSELARVDERQARLVELRYFAGLEVEEVAAAMDLSVSTVEREWRAARAWLGRRMQSREAP